MSQFQQRYAELHDEELIELALTRELAPEASEALRTELAKRGITDLSSHRAARQADRAAEESYRQEQVAHKEKVVGWRTKVLYFFALSTSSYGVYRLAVPNTENPGDDGGLMLILGIAIFLFALISSRLSKIWSEHVLHRRPMP